MKSCAILWTATVLTSAFACSQALAQSSVSIYGHVYLSTEAVRATDATPRAQGGSGNEVSATRMSSGPGIFGFRGTEALGGGLSAFFQLEGTLLADSGNATLFNRDTGVGLSHSQYGSIALGNFNAPMKYSSIRADPWRAYTFASYTAIINAPGFGVGQQVLGTGGISNTVSSFDSRFPNSLHYWSPNIGGFTTRWAVSMPEAKGETSVAPETVKPYVWGGMVSYEKGPVWVAYAYERHNDYFGLNNMVATLGTTRFATPPFATTNTGTHSKDDGHRISGAYTFGSSFGSTIVGFMADRLSYNESGTTGARELAYYTRDALYASVSHRTGPHEILGNIMKAFSGKCRTVAPGCSVAETGATGFNVGYHYHLSKRTKVGVQYGQIDNERNGTYGFGNSPLAGAGAGATYRAAGLIMQHSF